MSRKIFDGRILMFTKSILRTCFITVVNLRFAGGDSVIKMNRALSYRL